MQYYAPDNATVHQMVNNFRPLQPLNGRTVQSSFVAVASVAANSNSDSKVNSAPASFRLGAGAARTVAALTAIGAFVPAFFLMAPAF